MRSVTLRNIVDRATKRADMANSRFYSDEQKIDLFNEIYPELYDLLVAASENYYIKDPDATLTLVPGTKQYALPADFYKIVGVNLLSGGEAVTVKPFMEQERNIPLQTATSIPSATVTLRYVPAPAQFTVDDMDETIDGVSGWDALVVTEMAMAMLESEESDVTALIRRRDSIKRRIEEMAPNRDLSMPQRVQDIYQTDYFGRGFNSLRYRLYGNKIEFLAVEAIGYSI